MIKRKILMAVVTISLAGGMAACKKSGVNPKNDHSLNAGIAEDCGCSVVATSDSTISGQITTDLHLSNTVVYKLSGLVFVTGNHTLTIDPGTRILGLPGTADGSVAGGGLVITRGSKIQAVGTSSCPIVFTSYRYDNNPQSGDWSGIVLLGKAPTNNYPASIEGINNTLYPGIDVLYGSDAPDAHDNSGTMKFVRIEYGGYVLSPNNEINGLTFGGVGDGTTIDYVEVFKANDDSFEFFGGTVSPSHIISVDGLDDMFDTDNGYAGTISYALGMSDVTRPDVSQSNGLESDNNATGTGATPNTHAHYNHITIIGLPNATLASEQITIPPNGNASSGTGRYGRAAHLRRGAEFDIQNGIFLGFNYGLSIDTALGNTKGKYLAGTSSVTNTFVHAFGTSATAAAPHLAAYDVEGNGISATGSGFSLDAAFYNKAITDGNTGMVDADPGVLGLEDPFNRSSVGALNFMAGSFTDADQAGAGAFPGREDWTIVNGCYNWTRY
ncbi:hypothetical protein A3860_08265 [Niastella vici]|uniref:T9SS C-terminal target domain-containing protein n=1 Tax=Niastella vici TaxID=1703345 RepID=A0A1V9FGX3_9BACT|nr:hypothetical protein [Niastella vici]OQP57615.1 hypothetical protein A3860_08265 [Niastella vici]